MTSLAATVPFVSADPSNKLNFGSLAPVWVGLLQSLDITTVADLQLWRERVQPPSPDAVETLTQWGTRRQRIGELAAERNVTHSAVQSLLTDTMLRLLAPVVEDVDRWDQARRSGISDESIAALAGIPPVVVTLALDGWPSSSSSPPERVIAAHAAWAQGAPRHEVAAALGVPPERLIRGLINGDYVLTPARLTSVDLRSRFGWTPSAIALYRRKRWLPTPDGRDGTIWWWWQSTIDRWQAGRTLHWCDQCGQAFMATKGLAGHLTQVHS